MTRNDIRYAIFRCRSGNPEPQHLTIFELYKPSMEKLKLTIHDFADEWDISAVEPFDGIVTGGHMMLIHEIRDAPVVDEEGIPTDSFVAAIFKAIKNVKGK